MASRKHKVKEYPVLISSCLELISHHCSDLEGKQVAIICNPDNKAAETDAADNLTLTDSRLLGVGLFLALTKHNLT